MKTFNCGVARVTYKKAMNSQGGVMEVAYYGPICRNSFCYLRNTISGLAVNDTALVIRMDYAMFTLNESPAIPSGIGTLRCPPAAMIVRRDAYPMWADYSRRVASLGFKRAVFCDSQSALAYLWAEDHACLGRELLPL